MACLLTRPHVELVRSRLKHLVKSSHDASKSNVFVFHDLLKKHTIVAVCSKEKNLGELALEVGRITYRGIMAVLSFKRLHTKLYDRAILAQELVDMQDESVDIWSHGICTHQLFVEAPILKSLSLTR